MKRISLLVWAGLLALMVTAQTGSGDLVEVVYFHGKQRCATCMAIERNARELVEKEFAAQRGKVRFKVVDISTPEGAKLARDYRVTWSSLYVTRWRGGKEKRDDMTKFAFRYARSNPSKFKQGLRDEIYKQLK